MKKYNYFDDEPEFVEKKQNPFSKINFKKISSNARDAFENIMHGDALNDIKEIRELPNLQRAMFKISAFVLFVLAIIIFIIAFSHTINSQNKKIDQFYADAGKVCTDYITEYGLVKYESLDRDTYGKNMSKMTGLCYVRQMDFDNDGSDELMLCYHDKNIYTLEVWSYIGKEFSKVYGKEANRTEEDTDGSWIGLYHKNNKYYICQSNIDDPENVTLYALRGDSFEKSSECKYDYKDNIYSIKGKIDAQNFETIKLSVIKDAKAESIADTVTKNIDSFSTVSLSAIEIQKTPEQLKADAYFEIVENRIEKYGEAKVVTNQGKSYIDGVALVKLVDFDKDENDELLLVYRKKLRKSATNAYTGEFITIEEPTYCMEVYSWNGAVTQKIFSRDSISNYLEDRDTNYIMLQNSDKGVNICTNSYSYQSNYSYTASSRIYKMSDNEFTSAFNAKIENSYGYKNYYLNNKYSYQSEFEGAGYKVPMFMDDNANVDDSVYTLIYVSGKKGADFDSTVNETVKAIQSLNKNYTPEK